VVQTERDRRQWKSNKLKEMDRWTGQSHEKFKGVLKKKQEKRYEREERNPRN
jgi:hypothetical protein